MNKSFFWILAVVFALLQTSRAGDAFRISIIKGDAEPKLDKNQIEQFTKAGVASPDELPIIVCPQGKPDKDKPDPASTFQVVIENTQGIATAITMLGSDWYDCLSFKLVDDNGNSYSIQRWKDGGWFANAPGTR
ncbi:MAG TPA: hypothetical protein VG733_08155, partial [Chthoniobacteraceae bacterium]|nr:hypothetical protein [Chthoniobacteraceae bacterium]